MTASRFLTVGLLVGSLTVTGASAAAAAESPQPGTGADWKSRWTDPFEAERYVEVITAEEIWASNALDLPDLLRQRLSAWLTFSNYAGGSPTIRGLDGFDLTILLDGLPIPTTAYRFGDLEFLSTIDLELVERIEIVPQAAGRLGGWSAGPVIRLFTRRGVDAPQRGDEPGLDTTARAFYRFATIDKSSVAHLEAHREAQRFGFFFGLTSRDIGDLKAGDDLGFQRVTGYEEVAGSARIHYFLSPRRTLELDLQIHEQQNVPQYERLETATFLDFRLNPRKRALFKIAYLDATRRAWADRLEASIYLDQHRERSFEQLAARPEIRTQGSDNDDIEGLAARFDLERGGHRLSYGLDYTHEAVDAVRRDIETLTGAELERGPDRRRDGQERDLVSLWVSDRFALTTALDLVLSGRYTTASISGPFVGPAGTFGLDLEEEGVAASAGLVWKLADDLRVTAAWDTGFRLPALNEVTGFSPAADTAGVPNDDLEALSVDSLELGVRYRSERIRLQAAYFSTEIDHAAVLLPTSIDGSRFVDLDGDGVRDPGEPSFVRSASLGRAELDGFDLSFQLRPLDGLELFGSLHAVEGDDPAAGVPLAGIPPDHGVVGLRWSPAWRWHPWLQTELRFYDRKSRLAPGELAAARREPSSLEATEILQITAGLAVAERLRFVFSLENPSNEAYRPFGSFLVAGGRNLALTAEYVF